MEFSVRCPSPPNTYSYVREENSGSSRKFVENHLLFTCITNKILALCTIHPWSVEYVCKPCNPCWSPCKHIIVCEPRARKHIICLKASSWTRLGTHAKACLGKYLVCNFLCRRIDSLEWWNDTFLLLQFWLEKIGAYHSFLHFSWAGGSAFFLWVCLPDQHQVSLIYFPINFDSNASWSLQPPLGLYIDNVILGLLLVDVAINLRKSSDECEVLSSFKDFVDTAATANGAGAATFKNAKLVLLHGGGQGQLSSLEPALDTHCGCLGDAPGLHGACFHGGWRSHGRPSFQLSIHDTISKRIITHHNIQKHEAISASRLGCLFNTQLATSFVGC